MNAQAIKQISTALSLLLAVVPGEASSLIQNSPFLPPSYKKFADIPNKLEEAKKPEPARFVLKGISHIGSDYLFSIYDPATKKGVWIEAGTPHNGFTILKYYPSEKKIEYSWEGTTQIIELPKPDGEPIQIVYLNANGMSASRLSTSVNSSELNTAAQAPNGRQAYLSSETVMRDALLRDSTSVVPIIFQQRQQAAGAEAYRTLASTNNLFASVDTQGWQDEESAPPSTKRYQVNRRNTVNNPSGKKPEHMSFAQWQALNLQ